MVVPELKQRIKISKKRNQIEDTNLLSIVDLALPASTDPDRILQQFQDIKKQNKPGMTVVFSTYQSIDVIAEAQKEDGYLYVAHITGVSKDHDHWGGGGMGGSPTPPGRSGSGSLSNSNHPWSEEIGVPN